jgi:hypothetical protein
MLMFASDLLTYTFAIIHIIASGVLYLLFVNWLELRKHRNNHERLTRQNIDMAKSFREMIEMSTKTYDKFYEFLEKKESPDKDQ